MLRERLKKLRKRKGLTQSELADILGVERSTVGKWESAKEIIPPADMLIRIADYFNVSIDYILGREVNLSKEDRELLDYLEELRNAPEGKKMVRLLKGAKKEDVERAVRVIEALKE